VITEEEYEQLIAKNFELSRRLREAWDELTTWQEQVFRLRNQLSGANQALRSSERTRHEWLEDPERYGRVRSDWVSIGEHRRREILSSLETEK